MSAARQCRADPILELDGVSKRFATRPGRSGRGGSSTRFLRARNGSVLAVDDVSLELLPGETLSVVGESGCGKTTLGRIAAGTLEPDAGTVRVGGGAVRRGGRKSSRRVQTVPQDPYGSLDPRMRIGDAIVEGPIVHGLVSASEARAEARRWLERVGLHSRTIDRWPHELSGGQRQRVAIARALAMAPDVLVCDEPLASLDRSVQAQILNLFLELRQELSLALLFISHDLAVVRHLAGRVAVLYLGEIVEFGPTDEVLSAPAHPYTQGLIDCMSLPAHDGRSPAEVRPIAGEVPSAVSPPSGCRFHPRCPVAEDQCAVVAPPPVMAGPARWAACHLIDEVSEREPDARPGAPDGSGLARSSES